ncbi:FAM172 family protein homolog CG10038 isoform X2 [Drosophila novamexicana]|nr:FAM172 family protein homolog CG10038 isoform X2 [Drosophila novamexicana]
MSEPSARNSQEAIARLREFGYAFNEAGQLRKIDKISGEPGEEPYEFKISDNQAKNQEHYEQLANQIPEIIYELLEKNGLKRTYIPKGVPIEHSTFVFSQPQPLSQSKKLLVLIHGSGYVLAGQWARRLIINNSLDHGTQLPYIQRAQKLGYDILVTNTNDTTRMIKGKRTPIKGLENSMTHAAYVWEHIIMPSQPESVAIVAHSFGGAVSRALTEKYTKFFKEKVYAIALTDGTVGHPPAGCQKYFLDVTCNWVSSNEPLDTDLTQGDAAENITCVSAGHPEHEWTSYSAIESVFKFLEKKFEQHMKAKQVV